MKTNNYKQLAEEMKMMKYIIRDKERGNKIAEFKTRTEAEKRLKKENHNMTPFSQVIDSNIYEIVLVIN